MSTYDFCLNHQGEGEGTKMMYINLNESYGASFLIHVIVSSGVRKFAELFMSES